MLAAQIRQREQDGAQLPRARSAGQLARRRRRRQFKAVCWAVAAVGFLIGGIADVALGRAATSVVPFTVALVAIGWSRHHARSARSVE